MPSDTLGIIGIILTYVGIGLTLVAVGWTAHSQGRILANPDQQTRIGRQLQWVSWVWFGSGIIFLSIALFLFVQLRA